MHHEQPKRERPGCALAAEKASAENELKKAAGEQQHATAFGDMEGTVLSHPLQHFERLRQKSFDNVDNAAHGETQGQPYPWAGMQEWTPRFLDGLRIPDRVEDPIDCISEEFEKIRRTVFKKMPAIRVDL